MKKKWERVCALFLATVLFCSLLTSCGPKKVSSLRLEGIEQETDLHQLQTVTLAVEPAGADLDKIQLVSTDETVLTITRGDSHESGKDAAQLSCVIESKMDGEASVYAQTEDGSVKSEEILIQVVDREKLAQTQQNAQAVESAIRAIGEVTLDRADAIAQARSLYDNSPADVLVLVGNYSLLAEAEQTLILKQEEERARLAAEEEKRIAAEKEAAAQKAAQEQKQKDQKQAEPKKSSQNNSSSTPNPSPEQKPPRVIQIGCWLTESDGLFHLNENCNGIAYETFYGPSESLYKGEQKIPSTVEKAKQMGYQRCHACVLSSSYD